MKRIIAFLLAMIMCISVLGVTAFAADTAALTVETKNGTRGEEVTLLVNLAQNPGIAGMTFNISYDETRLEKVAFETVAFDDGNWTFINYPVWDKAGDSTATGTLLKLTFKVKEDAPDGKANVSVTCSAGNWDGERVTVSTGEGGVNVPEIHVHSYTKQVFKATCTEAGYTTYTCKCGDSYVSDEVAALGHSFTNYVSNNDATCSEDGTKTAKCDRCDATDTKADVGSATGDHNYVAVVIAPTCVKAGYTTYTCKCGHSYVGDEVAALGHSFTSYVSNGDATCTKDGTKTAKCDRCDATDTKADIGTASGHNYKAAVTAPTCTEVGYTTYTCACGDSYVEDEVVALGHDWTKWTAKDGISHTHNCTRCDAKETEAHNFNVEVENGVKCGDCGYVKQVSQECDHKYIKVKTVKPTCEEHGYTVYKCSKCGDEYADDFKHALGHEIEYKPNKDGKTHTAYCVRKGCDFEVKEKHEFRHGYCVCGAKAPTPPVCDDELDDVPQTGDITPMITMGVVAVLAAVVAMATAVFFLFKRKIVK